MQKLISIIVPVYNVEKYVGTCIESICNQTYSNLEIILVDDSSTDKSGTICDQYAQRDNRVKVIHKEHGGLSAARNAGVQAATGEYIGFVDSDDWIEPDMYEILCAQCIEENLDLVCCAYQREEEDNKSNNAIVENYTENSFVFMTSDDLLRANIYGSTDYMISNSVWNRLYRSELVKNLKFPEGKCYEDMCYSTEAFLHTKRGGYVRKVLYHYRIRKSSITGEWRSLAVPENVITDFLPLLDEQCRMLYRAGKEELGDECRFYYLFKILDMLLGIYNLHTKREEYSNLKAELQSYRAWVKKYARSSACIRKKVILLLGSYFTDFYVMLKGIRNQLLGKVQKV